MKHAKLLISCVVALTLLTGCHLTTSRSAVELFNKKDLSGWNYLSADPQIPVQQVWTVDDGILTCQGKPIGAIYKAVELTNFMLLVEYRWAPGTKPGNSGIFSRIAGNLQPIPEAVEVQLMHGNAGDVLGLQGRKITAAQPRFFEIKKHPLAGDIAGVKKISDQEKAAGDWNKVEIVARGPRYTVWVNRKLVNQVDGVDVVGGAIGLQSEEGVIQFRRVTLFPLP